MTKLSDARHLQIASQLGLLAYGQLALGFALDPLFAVGTVATALGFQAALDRRHGRPFEPRSALISSLSLCLLLRASHPAWGIVAAALAIGSKAWLRRGGRHVWNPSAFAIAVLLLATDRVWVSPGQWGSAAILALAMAGAGSVVLSRTGRGDATVAFLAAHASLLVGRALWLGDPLAIPIHQLRSGALAVFAFFMISDPRTLPDSRAGRVLFACAVATAGFAGRFLLWETDALVLALFAAAPLVAWIDRVLPGSRHRWDAGDHASRGETSHAPTPSTRRDRPRPAGRPALAG